MKKKKNIKKNKDNEESFKEEIISFGNKRIVFWSVTFATILLSIMGIPIIIQSQEFLIRFMIIWILEIIYIGMWVKWGEKKERIKNGKKQIK